MKLSDFCFLFAALCMVIGMTMGMVMGVTKTFTLTPVHAHLNLLGWVSMAVYGFYHRGGEDAGRLAMWQVGAASAGVPLFTGGLAGMLLAGEALFLPVTVAGSLLVLLGAILFLVLVARDIGARRPAA